MSKVIFWLSIGTCADHFEFDSIFKSSKPPQTAALSKIFFHVIVFSVALIFSKVLFAAENDKPSDRDLDCTMLRTIDGKPIGAKIVSCDKNWQITWQKIGAAGNPATDSKPESIAASDLYYWGCWRGAGGGQQLLLHGGGRVIGYLDAIDAEKIEFDSVAGLESIIVPRNAVRGVVFKPALYQKFLREEASQSTEPRKTSRVILQNGDQQSGEVVGWSGSKLTFKTASGTLTLDQKNLTALLFPDPLPTPPNLEKPNTDSSRPPKKVWLGFQDGSRVIARQLELVNEKWQVALTGGGQFAAERNAIVAIQPIDGRVTYLSDLEPSGYKHIPWLNTTWDYQRDRNVLRNELQCHGRTAIKGLGLHSAARISYTLDGEYDWLVGEIGIDDQAEQRGSAVCRIYIDTGDGQWKLRNESPVLRGNAKGTNNEKGTGNEKLFPLQVDVRGAKRISILVDYGDNGDTLDHVDLLNVGLVRGKK